MKVFNWVNRRFLNVNSCTNFRQENETEKDAISKVENEKHVLLEHDAHMVVEMLELDQWKDGILSIGTLSISPLDEATKYQLIDDEDDHDHDHDDGHDQEIINVHDDTNDDDDDDVINNYEIEAEDIIDDEASPLMNVEFFSHELEKVIGANHEITEEENVELKDNNDYVDVNDDIEGQTKRRVTLAELFMEDSDYHHPMKVLKELENDDYVNDVIKDDIMKEKQGIEMMKSTSRAKKGFSKAKKLLKEDLHLLKKFNQLMKRMMKKKIHPDLEAKMQKDMQMNPSNGLTNPTNEHDASNNELASLLLIQDALA